MVAIAGREVIRRAVDILCTHYNRYLAKFFYGQPTILGRSSSFVHSNPKKPASRQIPKTRKQGRVKRKRYNQLARDNSTICMPGGFPGNASEKGASRQGADDDLQSDYKSIDCDSQSADGAQAGWTFQEHVEAWYNEPAVNEDEAFVKKQLGSLLFEKDKRESQFKAKAISMRVKAKATERKARLREETKRAGRLWKMEELERSEEKERSNRWKDQRLAQLEREKRVAESDLAREKVERKHSKLQRVFKEQQQRREDQEHWKKLREKDAELAAVREDDLLRENARLRNNIWATDNAFREACNEREHMRQGKEEERARRLRAEESLHRWKELMGEYFPGGQQHPGQQQEETQQQPASLEAQFGLYEKKWGVLRSGTDIDGTEVHLIFFSQIPWPVVNMTPTDPSQIRPEHVREFLMHPLREQPDASGKRRSRKLKAKDELKRWHSDKFDRIVLSKVREEDKQAASEVARMITRVLINMLG